jgi:hypothetical protein
VSPPLDEVLAAARFVLGLPRLLRDPITVERARAALRARFEHRSGAFLDLVRRTVYAHPGSPYRVLLAHAGCEAGDLARLVTREGVEGALRALARSGVYLTVEELKGRRPVERGSLQIALDPAHLRNPFSAVAFRSRTGGSRGTATPVALDLGFVREMAVDLCLVTDARGELGAAHALWFVPGGDAVVKLLRLAAFGVPPVRWFSPVDLTRAEVDRRYVWSVRLLRLGGWLAGVPLPAPEHVPHEEAIRVARWMAGALDRGPVHLVTMTSCAVRVCQAAAAAGLSLDGATFSLSSEPTTAARLQAICRVGARAQIFYATVEAGIVGLGCLAPEAADEVHVLDDRLAVIQAPEEVAALPAGALLVSSLREAGTPLVLLNVSLGDRATVGARACGCALDRLGWGTHLHGIRSFQRVTAGGMTFLDADVADVLDAVLPARFGGGPTDYQVVEDEAADGRPRLRLLVHPRIGPVDPAAITDAFLDAIGRSSATARLMSLSWRDARLVQVERRPPLVTRAGKILHVHADAIT